jgi:Flp pilus assembly protein TadB
MIQSEKLALLRLFIALCLALMYFIIGVPVPLVLIFVAALITVHFTAAYVRRKRRKRKQD